MRKISVDAAFCGKIFFFLITLTLLLFFWFSVGGPLKFPDLTDSFLETEQNINETLLCKLEQELGGESRFGLRKFHNFDKDRLR